MMRLDIKNMIQGQQHIFDILKQNKVKDRMSHAYLFYGEDGVGKKEMAYALACLFYCEQDGCLECETCRTILSGQHLNVNYIGVEDSKKLISKEQIISLQEEFSKTSLVDGVRIYVVDGIDTASTSAQNSLLKFIEDPMNSTPTIGIFIAKDLANVVSTIISRCALFHFPSLSQRLLVQMLVTQGMDELDAVFSSSLTNNQEEAIAYLQQKEYQEMKSFFLNFLELRTTKEAILFYIQHQNLLQTQNMKMFFKWLIVFYEDIFKTQNKDELLFSPLYDKINVYIQKGFKQILNQFSMILEIYSKLDYNVSAKNIFHELISKIF